MQETPQLRDYLKSYGREYSKKYKSAHFSSPPGTVRIPLNDCLYLDYANGAGGRAFQ